MWFVRYSPRLATGAAGFVVGVFYQKLYLKQHVIVASAKPTTADINEFISREVESYSTDRFPAMKFGYPNYETLLPRKDFMVSYDRKNRNPGWVMEHLISDRFDHSGTSRKGKHFREDNAIHEFFRATLHDYWNSGYDKGHLARAANYNYNEDVYNDTYALTNITPQVPDCNQGIWLELENRVLKLAKKYRSIYVCSGPLYKPMSIHDVQETISQILKEDEASTKRDVGDGEEVKNKLSNADETSAERRKMEKENLKKKKENSETEKKNSTTEKEYSKTEEMYSNPKRFILYEVIGRNDVAVPTHYFKVILIEVESNVYDMEAYIIPNQKLNESKPDEKKKTLIHYRVNKHEIERLAGFLLFHKLPPNALRYVNGKENGSLY